MSAELDNQSQDALATYAAFIDDLSAQGYSPHLARRLAREWLGADIPILVWTKLQSQEESAVSILALPDVSAFNKVVGDFLALNEAFANERDTKILMHIPQKYPLSSRTATVYRNPSSKRIHRITICETTLTPEGSHTNETSLVIAYSPSGNIEGFGLQEGRKIAFKLSMDTSSEHNYEALLAMQEVFNTLKNQKAAPNTSS